MPSLRLAAACVLLLRPAHSLRAPPARLTRRAALLGGGAAALGSVPLLALASTRADLLPPGSAERCESGEGEACERLAGDNAYVKMLQERSRAKKAARVDEIFEKNVRQVGYSDYFDSLDRNMVLMPKCKENEDAKATSCGAYKLFTNEEYQKLKKEGFIETGSVDAYRPQGGSF